MAYMQHHRLVRLLKTGWKATCNYKQVLRKKSFKVVTRLEADNKTDADELEEARRKRDEIDHNCALANLKLYKMVHGRVLSFFWGVEKRFSESDGLIGSRPHRSRSTTSSKRTPPGIRERRRRPPSELAV